MDFRQIIDSIYGGLTVWIPEFSLALAVAAFACSAVAALLAARTATRVQALRDRLAASPPGSMDSLSKRVESLTTMLDEQGTALAELAQKVKMQRVRTAANHVRESRSDGELPDPYREPDAWRDAVNSRLARARIGGP